MYVKILKKADFNSSSSIAKVPTDQILKIIPNKVYTPKVWYIKYFLKSSAQLKFVIFQNLNINTDDGRNICYKNVSIVDPNSNSKNSTIQRLPSKQTTVKMIMPRNNSSITIFIIY